jgi:alpha-tubulin suppressor-like RCC1 family protein
MTTLNLGQLAIVWKGAYSGATTYTKNQAVSYNGNSYVCKVASVVGQLPTNATYWDVMSQGSNVLTTTGDLLFQDTSGANRLPIGDAGQVLTAATSGKPAWANNPGYKGPEVLTSDIPLVAASATTPWLIDSGASYFANNGLPNPACGPVKRSQGRLLGSTFHVWLNENHEVVVRGNDVAFRFAGTNNLGDTYGTRVLNNFSAANGVMASGDYFVQIYVAGNTLLALTKLGYVFAIGSGAQGLLGTGNTTDQYAWVKIPYLGPASTYNSLPNTIIGLHVGQQVGVTNDPAYANTLQAKTVHAIDVNGRVFAWGQNNFGQLGIGNNTAIISTPTLIAGNSGFLTADPLKKAVQISGSGFHTLIVDSSGQGYACGDNSNGALGIGTATNTAANYSLVAIAALTSIYQVEAIQAMNATTTQVGTNSFAIKTDGTLLACGQNTYGQVGNGGTVQQTSYQTIAGSYSSIYLEYLSVAALGGTPVSPNGTLYYWGYNANGQCCNGTVTTPVTAPAQPSATSQNTASAATSVDGSVTTTPLAYPRTGIKYVFGYTVLATPNGGWITVDANDNVWINGECAGINIVAATTAGTTSNQLAQKIPAPWNVADGWVGSSLNTVADMVCNGTYVTNGSVVIASSDGRQWALGGGHGRKYHDDGFFSAQFRQVTA